MFEDYTYVPGEEATPQVGTSDNGFDWDGFVKDTVRGVTDIIRVSRTPANTLPSYRGSGATAAASEAGASSNMLGIVVVGVLLFILLK